MIRQRVVCRDLVEKSMVIAMSFMAKFDEGCELDVVVGVCTAWVGESRGVVPRVDSMRSATKSIAMRRPPSRPSFSRRDAVCMRSESKLLQPGCSR